MMYAQSGPGTAISAKDSAANAMITLVSTISLPQTILPTWENSTVKPAQCAPYFQSQTRQMEKIYCENGDLAQDSVGADKAGANKLWHTGHNGERNHFNI